MSVSVSLSLSLSVSVFVCCSVSVVSCVSVFALFVSSLPLPFRSSLLLCRVPLPCSSFSFSSRLSWLFFFCPFFCPLPILLPLRSLFFLLFLSFFFFRRSLLAPPSFSLFSLSSFFLSVSVFVFCLCCAVACVCVCECVVSFALPVCPSCRRPFFGASLVVVVPLALRARRSSCASRACLSAVWGSPCVFTGALGGNKGTRKRSRRGEASSPNRLHLPQYFHAHVGKMYVCVCDRYSV